MDRSSWPEAVVAVAFLALLGFCLWLAVDKPDNFESAWGLVAPLVGIIIGAIPSYFFRIQAAAAEGKAEKLEGRLSSLLQFADKAEIAQAKAAAPTAWSP